MQDIRICYMRDNHAFLRLSLDVGTALNEIKEEWEAGYTHGMVCSKSPGMPPAVHAQGRHRWEEFSKAVRAYYAAVPKLSVKEEKGGGAMMDLLLTPQERERFAAWLEHEAAAAVGLIAQVETLGMYAAPLIAREKAEASAALLIARKLRSTHSDSVG